MRSVASVSPARVRTTMPGLGFVASTGRTATMFIAAALDALPGVVGLHEGHEPDQRRMPRLPLINMQNRQAWRSDHDAGAVVEERRGVEDLMAAAVDAEMVVDVAFYNAPLVHALCETYPTASILAVVRSCEGFVRSATIFDGEDMQPAGWPDPAKALTDRERFIELGRLRPHRDSADAQSWSEWSGIQRNIWLWHTVNRHLLDSAATLDNVSIVRFEQLRHKPEGFWSTVLDSLDLATDNNVASCVARSVNPVNARSSYQVGPLDTWTEAEQQLHYQLAMPLEAQLND